MMIHCKNCKKKFYHSNENDELEGKVIQCKFCDEQWLYVTRTKYLENRLIELNQDLDNTESKINLRKLNLEKQPHERIAKSTSLGRRPKTSSMNKNKKRTWKKYVGQGR